MKHQRAVNERAWKSCQMHLISAAASVHLLWFGLDVTGRGGAGRGGVKAVASPLIPQRKVTELKVKPKARRHFCSINGNQNNQSKR